MRELCPPIVGGHNNNINQQHESTKMTLFLNHIYGDCGYSLNGNTHDVLGVTLENGDSVALVRVNYIDNYKFTVEVEGLYEDGLSMLDDCSGEVHFTASVLYVLAKGLTGDMDFYFQQFYVENEDGTKSAHVKVPFELLPL